MTEYRKGILATAVAAILWSTGGLFIKLLPFDAWTILFYRSLYAAILFALVYRKELLQVNTRMFLTVAVYVGLLSTFVVSTKLTTAANAIFLQYTGTAYVLLLEPILRKRQTGVLHYQRLDVWTMIICFLGMGLFFSGGLQADNLLGIGIAAISGLLLAALILSQRSNGLKYQVPAIFWGNMAVLLVSFPAWLRSEPPTLPEHGMLAFLGFIQIGMGYLLFTYGLKRITATESALIAMLEPVLNPVWVLIGYGEVPSFMSLVGGGLIIAALTFRVLARKPASPL